MDGTMQMICDLSNAVLLVAQTDVVSLWSAGRIHAFLQEGAGRDRLRIVLNRYKKIPGFSDEDVEKATNCSVLWKVPNNFQLIGARARSRWFTKPIRATARNGAPAR
jgi:Flp pilus assembly CpaE family ATPase